jgi:ATP phosphoribosyltransferase
MNDDVLRFAIPSDGELHASTMDFLHGCGLSVERPNRRQYTATLTSTPNVQILFQRASDIPHNIAQGSADLGIVGHDRFSEENGSSETAVIAMADLGYGQAQLVTAVPTSWIDVNDMIDLADLDAEFRSENRALRIATKYPKLVSKYLHEKGLRYFSLVHASGALEAAPVIGYADVIVDISSTGTTLRENQLKQLTDGVVFSSAACLVANSNRIGLNSEHSSILRSTLKFMMDNMEGYLQAKHVYVIAAELYQDRATFEESPNSRNLERFGPLSLSDLKSETQSSGINLTMTVHREQLREVVSAFRNVGATTINVIEPKYLFQNSSTSYDILMSKIGSTNFA